MDERIRQYDKGFADAVDKVILLLTLGVDGYPRIPSERTLSLIMDPSVARKILDCLRLMDERLKRAPAEVEMVGHE